MVVRLATTAQLKTNQCLNKGSCVRGIEGERGRTGAWRASRSARAAVACLLLALTPLTFANTARAQTNASQPAGSVVTVDQAERDWDSYTSTQKFAVIEQLYQSGQPDVAERLLARTQATTPNDIKLKRFYTGMVAKAQGRLPEATTIFRELLASDPQFARVRLELAHALFAAKEDEGAKHHFELVLGGSAADPNLSNVVKGYLQAITSRRTWEFSSYVSIAPSTNLNQGSANKTVELNGLQFTLNEANQKKSGIGVIAGFQGGYRLPLTGSLDLVTTAGVHAKRYNEDDFNNTLATATFGPRFRFEAGQIGVYGTVEKRWLADEDLSLAYGALVAASLRLGVQDQIHGDVACQQRSNETNWRDTDLSYQDGHACQASLRFEHAFNSASYVRFLGGVGQERTQRLHLDNDSWFAGAGLHNELPWGISLYAQGLFTQRDYEGLFPGSLAARSDDRVDLSLNVTKRDLVLFGLAPMVQYTYTINNSNVGFYQYDAHGVSLTLTKQF
jgi:outer membrane protein